jgi:hypothetical protein
LLVDTGTARKLLARLSQPPFRISGIRKILRLLREEKCGHALCFRIKYANVSFMKKNNQPTKPAVSVAAGLMGKRSAQERLKKWGRKEFSRRMREYGKLGGRPPKHLTGKKEK